MLSRMWSHRSLRDGPGRRATASLLSLSVAQPSGDGAEQLDRLGLLFATILRVAPVGGRLAHDQSLFGIDVRELVVHTNGKKFAVRVHRNPPLITVAWRRF